MPTCRRRALAGVRGVIHTAGWVSLGPDHQGISHSTNVELTKRLLARRRRRASSDLFTRRLCTRWRRERRSDRRTSRRTWNLRSARLVVHPHQAGGRANGAGGERGYVHDDRALPGDGAGPAGSQADVDADRPGFSRKRWLPLRPEAGFRSWIRACWLSLIAARWSPGGQGSDMPWSGRI